jgi:hypothetical protein
MSLASDRAVADREPGVVMILFRRQPQTPPRPSSGAARCCGRDSRARLVSGVVDDEALGMLVVQGGASLRAAGMGQG